MPAPADTPRGPRRDAGFTLFEVLVALGVCGFVIAALVPVLRANALQARSADGRLALVLAERRILESLPARDEMREGVTNGRIDDVSFRIEARALPDDSDPERPLPWQAFRLVIDLEAADGRTSRVSTTRLGKVERK